jgi:hypothetical protein
MRLEGVNFTGLADEVVDSVDLAGDDVDRVNLGGEICHRRVDVHLPRRDFLRRVLDGLQVVAQAVDAGLKRSESLSQPLHLIQELGVGIHRAAEFLEAGEVVGWIQHGPQDQ